MKIGRILVIPTFVGLIGEKMYNFNIANAVPHAVFVLLLVAVLTVLSRKKIINGVIWLVIGAIAGICLLFRMSFITSLIELVMVAVVLLRLARWAWKRFNAPRMKAKSNSEFTGWLAKAEKRVQELESDSTKTTVLAGWKQRALAENTDVDLVEERQILVHWVALQMQQKAKANK